MSSIFCLSLLRPRQVWIVFVIMDFILIVLGRAIQDDTQYLCFPSPKMENFCICFDMSDSSFMYLPLASLPAEPEVVVETSFLDMVPQESKGLNTEPFSGKRSIPNEAYKIRSLLLDMIHRLSKYPKYPKHTLSKRPFDSIEYGSYFGGFGKK